MTSENLSQRTVVDSIKETIRESGESLVISERFTNPRGILSALNLRPWEFLKIQRDPKTNLPIENSFIRRRLVDKIDHWIYTDKPFLFVHVDADGLKAFNDDTNFGRDVGDILIKRSAALSLRVINDALDLSHNNISAVALRPTHSADELCIWIFCNDVAEVGNIKRHLDDIDKPLAIKIGNSSFSSTATFADSSEKMVIEAILKYKHRILSSGFSRQKIRPYEVLKAVENSAAVKAQLLKEVKLILTLPDISTLLKMSVDEFEQAIITIKNNHRGVEALERILLRLTRIHEKNMKLGECKRIKEIERIKAKGYLGLFPDLNM